MANAHKFISGFEKGYHTLVGERGIVLSGGQKQVRCSLSVFFFDSLVI